MYFTPPSHVRVAGSSVFSNVPAITLPVLVDGVSPPPLALPSQALAVPPHLATIPRQCARAALSWCDADARYGASFEQLSINASSESVAGMFVSRTTAKFASFAPRFVSGQTFTISFWIFFACVPLFFDRLFV